MNTPHVIPLRQFNTVPERTNLAKDLFTLGRRKAVVEHLRSRSMLRSLELISGTRREVEFSMDKLHREDFSGDVSAAVLLGDSENVLGLAIGRKAARATQLRLKLPTPSHPLPLKNNIRAEGMLVRAWAAPGEGMESGVALRAAYTEVPQPRPHATIPYVDSPYGTKIRPKEEKLDEWTIEPMDAPHWVHTAIRAGGYAELEEAGRGHFSVRTDGLKLYDQAVLYKKA